MRFCSADSSLKRKGFQLSENTATTTTDNKKEPSL